MSLIMHAEDQPRRPLRVGDRVRVLVETDHPEDEVGVVAMFLSVGRVVVQFPTGGAEVHALEDLSPAEPS